MQVDYEAEAHRLGITFNGMQELPHHPARPMFTDPKTGSSFMPIGKETIEQALSRNRTSFIKSEIFDMNSTGVPFYDNLFGSTGALRDNVYEIPQQDYYRKHKGVVGKVVFMSPEEYLSKIKWPERVNEDQIGKIGRAVSEGHKIFMPFLDYSSGTLEQEGRHRATLAKRRGIKAIPVLVVTKAENKADRPSESNLKAKMDKTRVLLSSSCEHCVKLRAFIKQHDFPVKIVMAETREGEKLIQEHKIRFVPIAISGNVLYGIKEVGNELVLTDQKGGSITIKEDRAYMK